MLPGIGLNELVFGVPCSRIVNAAFTHAHPLGSRFNSPERGARYAAFEIETAQAEVAFHKSVDLAEIGRSRTKFLSTITLPTSALRSMTSATTTPPPHTLIRTATWHRRHSPNTSSKSAHWALRIQAYGMWAARACMLSPALVMNVRKDERIASHGAAQGSNNFSGLTKKIHAERMTIITIAMVTPLIGNAAKSAPLSHTTSYADAQSLPYAL